MHLLHTPQTHVMMLCKVMLALRQDMSGEWDLQSIPSGCKLCHWLDCPVDIEEQGHVG